MGGGVTAEFWDERMTSRRTTKFLLIEDQSFLSLRLGKMLDVCMDGATEVDTAANWKDAEFKLSSGVYDVCFLNHQLEGRESLELLELVDTKHMLTAVIFLVDDARRDLAYDALRSGVDDLLLKAKFDQFELEKAVAYSMYRKFKQVELQKSVLKDSLTGVGNRVLFEEQLKTAMARAERDGERVGILYLDLDGFKPVNDQYGHAVGDKLLQAISERLVERTRSSDVIARVGGDEFAAILVKVDDREAVTMVGTNMQAAISNEAYAIEGQRISIGASVGVSVFPDDGKDIETLVRVADKNMYTSKIKRRGALGGGGIRNGATWR